MLCTALAPLHKHTHRKGTDHCKRKKRLAVDIQMCGTNHYQILLLHPVIQTVSGAKSKKTPRHYSTKISDCSPQGITDILEMC